jgi:peptidoglycan/LPS O-acetylase OafA/YrhL
VALAYFNKLKIFSFLNWKIWDRLSPLAYMIFLMHGFVIALTMRFFPHTESMPRWIVFTSVVLATILVSAASLAMVGIIRKMILKPAADAGKP